MNFSYKTEKSGLMLLISLIIHALALFYLFLMIIHPKLEDFLTPPHQSPIHVPVIFTQPSPQAPPIKPPLPALPSLPEENIPVAQVPSAVSHAALSAQPTHKASPSPSSAHKEKSKESPTEQATSKKEASLKKSSTTLLEKTDHPAIFSLPKEPKKAETIKDHGTDHSGLRNKKLMLEDLFKDLLPANTTHDENTTADGMLIISQGDMKYYSFLQKFITHINQVFSFHGGPALAHTWTRKGVLSKNAALSVVIDKQGKVLDAKITQSSGYKPFDELSLKTVYQASPFPPIPDRLQHDKVRVDLASYL